MPLIFVSFDIECPNAHMLMHIKSTIKSAHTPPTDEGISYTRNTAV